MKDEESTAFKSGGLLLQWIQNDVMNKTVIGSPKKGRKKCCGGMPGCDGNVPKTKIQT